MARHPLHDVAIVGVHNTRQGRVLEDTDSRMITMEATLGAIEDAGLSPLDVDGVVGQTGSDFIYQTRIGPVWRSMSGLGIPAILEAAAEAGAKFSNFVLVRLPHAVAPLFETWLGQHFPDRKEKVLNRLRDLHGGKLYDSAWGRRSRVAGAYAQQIEQVFRIASQLAAE